MKVESPSLFRLFAAIIILALPTLSGCKEGGQEALTEDLPKEATVLSDGLKVRLGPNTMAAEVGRLSSGEKVKILNRSRETVRIGGLESNWYQIQSEEGLKGWTFGGYLSIGTGAGEQQAKADADRQKELRTFIIGRWYAVTATGTLKPWFLSLFKDGEFEMGQKKTVRSFGKYELEFEGPTVRVVLTEAKSPPIITEIVGELRGATFTLSGNIGSTGYNFQITEKNPESFRPEKKAEKN